MTDAQRQIKSESVFLSLTHITLREIIKGRLIIETNFQQ